MKKLIFNNQEFEAEKIIKTETDIVGKDLNDNELFAFRGISDFSGFVLEEGQSFDIQETELDKASTDLKASDSYLLKLSMLGITDVQALQQAVIDLQAQIDTLKAGV